MLVLSCVECFLVENYVRQNYMAEELYFLNSLGAHFDLDDSYENRELGNLITSNDINSVLYVVDINCNYYQKVLDKVQIPKSPSLNVVIDKIVNNYSFIQLENNPLEHLHLLSELFFIETFEVICSTDLLSNLNKKAILVDLKNNRIIKKLEQ